MKSVIQLVKTSHGYSVVQEGIQINRVSGRALKQKHYNSAPKKFPVQNFTIYPYVYCQETQENQKYIIVPAKSQWFNLNQVHEIEKKALPQWFKTKKVVFGAAKPDKFQKNQDLYKKYRNYIIQLGRNQYISATRARRGLAGDVCSILRIYAFLENNGLINYVFSKNKFNNSHDQSKRNPQHVINLTKRKDCIDKQKSLFDKHFDKDHLQLLKKITKKFRPACHLCQGICGVVWYEYEQQLYLKTFEQSENKHYKKQQQMKNEEQKKQEPVKHSTKKNHIIKSQKSFNYLLRLCSSCFTSGNLPIVLSHQDFKKISILDKISYFYEEPKDKKKIAQQNKLLQSLQKNRFNYKKTSQTLKINEQQLLLLLLCLPLIKIQKLARIDAQTDQQTVHPPRPNPALSIPNGTSPIGTSPSPYAYPCGPSVCPTPASKLLPLFLQQCSQLKQQQVKLYEQLIQIWLLKVSTKMNKLSQWEKSINWFTNKLIDDEKNSLAEMIKIQDGKNK